MRWLRHPAVYWVASIGLGAVFIYASLDKIAHPLDFARIVYRYQLAGPSAALGVVPANVLAVVLPWVEIATGLLLITGLWRREAALVAGAMLVMFLVAVGYVLWQGIDVGHCGCFTVGGRGPIRGLDVDRGRSRTAGGGALRRARPPANGGIRLRGGAGRRGA